LSNKKGIIAPFESCSAVGAVLGESADVVVGEGRDGVAKRVVVGTEPLDSRLDTEGVDAKGNQTVDEVDDDPEGRLVFQVLGHDGSKLLGLKASPGAEAELLNDLKVGGRSEGLIGIGILAVSISKHVDDVGEENDLLIEAEVGPPEPLEPVLLVIDLLVADVRRKDRLRVRENRRSSNESEEREQVTADSESHEDVNPRRLLIKAHDEALAGLLTRNDEGSVDR